MRPWLSCRMWRISVKLLWATVNRSNGNTAGHSSLHSSAQGDSVPLQVPPVLQMFTWAVRLLQRMAMTHCSESGVLQQAKRGSPRTQIRKRCCSARWSFICHWDGRSFLIQRGHESHVQLVSLRSVTCCWLLMFYGGKKNVAVVESHIQHLDKEAGVCQGVSQEILCGVTEILQRLNLYQTLQLFCDDQSCMSDEDWGLKKDKKKKKICSDSSMLLLLGDSDSSGLSPFNLFRLFLHSKL